MFNLDQFLEIAFLMMLQLVFMFQTNGGYNE